MKSVLLVVSLVLLQEGLLPKGVPEGAVLASKWVEVSEYDRDDSEIGFWLRLLKHEGKPKLLVLLRDRDWDPGALPDSPVDAVLLRFGGTRHEVRQDDCVALGHRQRGNYGIALCDLSVVAYEQLIGAGAKAGVKLQARNDRGLVSDEDEIDGRAYRRLVQLEDRGSFVELLDFDF